MIHSVERSTTLRSTNVRQAQQMSNVARRLLHIQRHAPVALLVEPDLHAHTSEMLVNAIRGGRIVRIRWSELTPGEQRQAHVNLFHSYE
jgi:hypothetical protein